MACVSILIGTYFLIPGHLMGTQQPIQVVYFDMGGVLADDLWAPTEEFVLQRYLSYSVKICNLMFCFRMGWGQERQKEFKILLRKLWNIVKVKPEPTEV